MYGDEFLPFAEGTWHMDYPYDKLTCQLDVSHLQKAYLVFNAAQLGFQKSESSEIYRCFLI